MKRMCRVIVFMLLLVLLLGIAVKADVIFEWSHRWAHEEIDCETYGRTHIVNAKDGYAKVLASLDGDVTYYTSLEGKIITSVLPNGTEIEIICTLEDGKWGFVRYLSESRWIDGYIELDQTIVKYDCQSFLEEHRNEFYEDDGTAILMLKNVSRPYTYDYPGAPASFSKVMNTEELVENNFVFEFLYKDENGRVWGDLGETVNGRDWVCLSDPISKDLPVIDYQTIELYPASGEDVQSPPSGWVLPACLVVGVVIVSGLLLLVLKRKK